MNEYLVSWNIQIIADTPVEAARKALEIQRDPNSIASVFRVEDWKTGRGQTIDLDELDNQE